MDKSEAGGEQVVPIVEPWPQAPDGRMEGLHGSGHGFCCRIGIEATEDGNSRLNEVAQPMRIRTRSSGGDASIVRMKGKAADGVDGRFAEDYGPARIIDFG